MSTRRWVFTANLPGASRARWTSQQVVERGQRAAACLEKEKKRERVGARGRQTAHRCAEGRRRTDRDGNTRRRCSATLAGRGDERRRRAREPRRERTTEKSVRGARGVGSQGGEKGKSGFNARHEFLLRAFAGASESTTRTRTRARARAYDTNSSLSLGQFKIFFPARLRTPSSCLLPLALKVSRS